MNINWDEMPEWADVWIEDLRPRPSYNESGWHKDNGDRWLDQKSEYFLKSAEVRGNIKVHYPPAKQWRGPEDGLPPVGTTCEIKPYWHTVLVVAHDAREEGVRIVFWDHHDSIYSYVRNSDLFRPIKSDREKWIDAAFDLAARQIELDSSLLEIVYDALQSGELPTPKGVNNA